MLRERNKGIEVENIVQFFDHGIVVFNPLSGNRTDYTYIAVSRMFESKNLIVLVTAAKNAVIVDKGMFTIGTAEDFRNFIVAKRKI